MNKIKEIFNIQNFNIIQDEKYYYLFRALNEGDHKDLENKIITDKNGKIVKIRTDRKRYIENQKNVKPKYEEDEPISLMQVIDHIKENHRYDTNCISLSNNANISIRYGNGYYHNEYVVIRVPKSEMGINFINAGEYILEKINKIIEDSISKLVKSLKPSPQHKEIMKLLDKVDLASSREEILDLILLSYKYANTKERIYKGKKSIKKIPLRVKINNYTNLNDQQNLLKNQIIGKLIILEEHNLMKPIIPNNIIDSTIIITLERAFSSDELLHYGEINEKYIFETKKEIIDMLGFLQEIMEVKPEYKDKILKMENNIIKYITQK